MGCLICINHTFQQKDWNFLNSSTISSEAVKPVSSVPLDDASRRERARRERAERKERWDAIKQARTRTMKRVSRSNELLDPCYGNLRRHRLTLVRRTLCRLWAPGKQRSAYYIPPLTACSVTIINLHATPNPLLRLCIQSCHLVEINTLFLNLVAVANWLSLAFARYAPLNVWRCFANRAYKTRETGTRVISDVTLIKIWLRIATRENET